MGQEVVTSCVGIRSQEKNDVRRVQSYSPPQVGFMTPSHFKL